MTNIPPKQTNQTEIYQAGFDWWCVSETKRWKGILKTITHSRPQENTVHKLPEICLCSLMIKLQNGQSPQQVNRFCRVNLSQPHCICNWVKVCIYISIYRVYTLSHNRALNWNCFQHLKQHL